MKLYHKNPRQITEKQFTDLGGSLSRLGDLGGIVHDLNSDEIIGGNQRSRVFDINQCDIQLIEQYLEPDEQGTVGLGFVVWKGKKYAYRQVRWTPKQCEEANIRANKNGGSFDNDVLANDFELDDLIDWGFEKFELGISEIKFPDDNPQKEPILDSECFIEIYCSKDDLSYFQKTLNDWKNRIGVTINIS